MHRSDWSRRCFLGSLLGAALPSNAAGAAPPSDHGRVNPPVRVPQLTVTRHDGVSTDLFSLFNQRATAVQFMFTGCTTTCPLQGAMFHRVQQLVSDQVARGIQLVSLSIDPERDTPAALTVWLRRFQAAPGWVAAAPLAKDIQQIRRLGGPGRTPADNHTTQIFLIDRQGRLVWRTFELPEAEDIALMLGKL